MSEKEEEFLCQTSHNGLKRYGMEINIDKLSMMKISKQGEDNSRISRIGRRGPVHVLSSENPDQRRILHERDQGKNCNCDEQTGSRLGEETNKVLCLKYSSESIRDMDSKKSQPKPSGEIKNVALETNGEDKIDRQGNK